MFVMLKCSRVRMGILNDHLNPRLSGCRLAYKLGGRDPQSSAVSAEALGRLHRNLSNSPTAIFVTQAHPGSLNCSAVFVDVAQLRVTTSKHSAVNITSCNCQRPVECQSL